MFWNFKWNFRGYGKRGGLKREKESRVGEVGKEKTKGGEEEGVEGVWKRWVV